MSGDLDEASSHVLGADGTVRAKAPRWECPVCASETAIGVPGGGLSWKRRTLDFGSGHA